MLDDTGEAERRMKETVRAIYAEGMGTPGKDEREKLIKHALSSEAAYKLRAAVTLAEIHLEHGRGAGGDAALASALAALERAGGLAGCQNRVNLITARTHLERGRRATAPS